MSELFREGGWVFAAILGLSLLGWSVLLHKWLQLRAEQAGGLRWMDEALVHLAAHRTDRARGLCRARSGLAARLLDEAVGTTEPQRRFFEVHVGPVIRAERTRLRGHLPIAAIIAGLCPLLGLLGTVLGMMATFRGVTAGGAVEPDALAGGVSQALITTQAGLVMALPLLLIHGYLNSRIDRFLDAVGLRIRKVETLVCRD